MLSLALNRVSHIKIIMILIIFENHHHHSIFINKSDIKFYNVPAVRAHNQIWISDYHYYYYDYALDLKKKEENKKHT
jgi:hypothetical protein